MQTEQIMCLKDILDNFKVCNVVSFHPRRESNPYFQLFFSALRPYGIELLEEAIFDRSWFFKNRNKIQIVHLHWLTHFIWGDNFLLKFRGLLSFIRTIVYLKKLKIKLVWTCHNFLPHENADIIDFLFTIFTANLADLIICHSNSSRRELLRFVLRHNKICVMAHGTYSTYYKNNIEREEARKRLNLPEKAFVYLFFGGIRRYKGVDELIEAFSKLDDEQSFLYIVGTGINDNYVEEYIIPRINGITNITLVNSKIKDEDIQIYFNACDAVVYPFKKITSSGSLMLAYTFTKPVVLRDCGLTREMFNNETAVYFSDKTSLIVALKRVKQIDANKVAEILRNKAREFEWAEVIKKIANRYRDIMKQNSWL